MTALTEHPASGADVLVVGGGPAGCAVAIPLARNGARVVVVERNPATRPYGFANLISPRSIDALDELGVTTQQWAVLASLSRPHITKGMGINEMCDYLRVSRQSL